MKKARIINAIFWLYVWLSDRMDPITKDLDHFWSQWFLQWVEPNRHIFSTYYNFPGADWPCYRTRPSLFIPWLAIDWMMRRSGRKDSISATTSQP
jgi:hypothetical protein